jgi:hypothetical protein
VGLGRQLEQPVDELILSANIIITDPPRLSLADHIIASYPANVRRAAWNARKPCLACTRRLIARWSCSKMLFKY